MVQASEKGMAEVYLAMSTVGGQVQAGIALYNTLLAMPFALTIHNIGSVNSIGNVIFLGRFKTIHDPERHVHVSRSWFRCSGSHKIEEQFARDRLDSILSDQKRMGQIITSRSNIGEDTIAKLFRTQTHC